MCSLPANSVILPSKYTQNSFHFSPPLLLPCGPSRAVSHLSPAVPPNWLPALPLPPSSLPTAGSERPSALTCRRLLAPSVACAARSLTHTPSLTAQPLVTLSSSQAEHPPAPGTVLCLFGAQSPGVCTAGVLTSPPVLRCCPLPVTFSGHSVENCSFSRPQYTPPSHSLLYFSSWHLPPDLGAFCLSVPPREHDLHKQQAFSACFIHSFEPRTLLVPSMNPLLLYL